MGRKREGDGEEDFLAGTGGVEAGTGANFFEHQICDGDCAKKLAIY